MKNQYKLPSEYISGKKTYVVGFMIIVITVAQAFGFVSAENFIIVISILLGLGVVCLRLAIKKCEQAK